MSRMLTTWNAALDQLSGQVTPDSPRPLTRYGTALLSADLAVIPECDLPAGLPSWMRSERTWADREGVDAMEKRATIVVRIPTSERPF